MNTKTIAAGIAGGVAFFLLGWLVYGMMLSGYYEANTNQCMAKGMEDMTWWALIGFNFVWGFLLALIFSWTDTNDFMDGLMKGALIGFLVTLAYDLSFYSFTTMFSGMTIMAVDVIVGALFTGIVGGLIAVVRSKVA